jgi:hypothetical protein
MKRKGNLSMARTRDNKEAPHQASAPVAGEQQLAPESIATTSDESKSDDTASHASTASASGDQQRVMLIYNDEKLPAGNFHVYTTTGVHCVWIESGKPTDPLEPHVARALLKKSGFSVYTEASAKEKPVE